MDIPLIHKVATGYIERAPLRLCKSEDSSSGELCGHHTDDSAWNNPGKGRGGNFGGAHGPFVAWNAEHPFSRRQANSGLGVPSMAAEAYNKTGDRGRLESELWLSRVTC
jgi:hypothetical protein